MSIVTKTLRLMQFTAFFLLVLCLQVSATGVSQTVTLSGKDLPLEKVFGEVKRQTGYVVVGNFQLLQAAKPVTVHAEHEPVEEFIKNILRDQPLTYSILNTTISIRLKSTTEHLHQDLFVSTPPITVRGRVLDDEGQPLAGASVSVKNSKNAGVTDAEGLFTLSVTEGDVIIVSFVGYQSKDVKISSSWLNRGTLNITLSKASIELDETIVQAYGTTTKRTSTGSISVVKSEELQRQPVSNLMSALEGLVPGLQISQQTAVIGGNYNIQLRGQNSLLQNSNPLYVVDGVPYPSTTLTEITSGSALGLDGASPLNGINMADVESVSVLKDAAATAIYGARGANGVILITMKKGKKGDTRIHINAYSGWGKNTRHIDWLDTEQYLSMRHEAFDNAGATPNPASAPDLLVWDTTRYTDWQRYFTRQTAHYNDLQASVSGGNGNTGFLLGGGYHQEGTVFPGSAADKKGAMHFNLNHRSTNGRLGILLTGSFTHDVLTLPPVDLTGQASLPPDQPELVNADGSLNWAPGGFNPLAYLKQPYRSVSDNLVSNASISYAVLPGLQLKADMGYTDLRSAETQITPLISINPDYLSFSKSSSSFGNHQFKVWNIEPQISFSRQWGSHVFAMLVGSTIQSSFNSGMLLSGTDFVSDALLTNVQAAGSLTVLNNTNTQTRDNSVFGRLSYNQGQKYLVDLTARRDGSSRFGPGKQFANFGALGLGWVLTREPWMRELLPWINFAKLRLSYGTVGNAPGSDYNYLSLWSTTAYPYAAQPSLYPVNLYNPDYAWELTRKLEVGADLEFAMGRMKLTADYYRNRSSNQLVAYNLATITGFTGVTANLPATVQNTGWEFTLQTINVQTTRLKWATQLTFSAPRNQLVAFPNLQSSSYASQYLIGSPVYINQRYHYTGVNPQSGTYEFQSKSGASSFPSYMDDRYSLYDSKPRYWGGFGNDISFAHFTLHFLFTFAKQKGLNTDPPVIPGQMANLPATYLNRWRKAGDVSVHQKVTTGYDVIFPYFNLQNSDYFVEDASFIRLKNLSLAYQLAPGLLAKSLIQSARVYLQCQNLLTITKFHGLDPETQGSSTLPPLRVITFGIQVTL